MTAKLTNQEEMKWFMLIGSFVLFAASVIVKLFKPATQINVASNVFIAIAALVLGSSTINFFRKDE